MTKVVATEPNAVLAFPPGHVATGHAEIRAVFEEFVAAAPVLSPGRQHPALVSGDVALTATTLTTGEVTRRDRPSPTGRVVAVGRGRAGSHAVAGRRVDER